MAFGFNLENLDPRKVHNELWKDGAIGQRYDNLLNNEVISTSARVNHKVADWLDVEGDFSKWDDEVWSAKAQGAASGFTTGGWIGAVVGSAAGTLGALKAQKERLKAATAEESAREANRRSLTSKRAIAGLQASRARQTTINEAIRKRATSVSEAKASGVKGSGQVGSIASQLQGELQYESIAQQLSKRAGTWFERAQQAEDKANRAKEKEAETIALTNTAINLYSTFGGSGTDSSSTETFG
jgi:hypothetical protein